MDFRQLGESLPATHKSDLCRFFLQILVFCSGAFLVTSLLEILSPKQQWVVENIYECDMLLSV
jgi:hypothetical protein